MLLNIKSYLAGRWQRPVSWLLSAAILYFFALTIAAPINLTTADLGRHIINGHIFFESGQVLATNHYSFTQPDFPTLTTHWASGPVFYALHKFFGFYGTQFYYILLYVIALGLMLNLAIRFSTLPLAIFSAVLCMPLLITRPEVRPEVFTYLFVALFLYVLYCFKQNTIKLIAAAELESIVQKTVGYFGSKTIWLLPIAQIIWVNNHILFPLGVLIIGVFFADSWLTDRKSDQARSLWRLLWVTGLACLINPWGLKGALAPILVMKEYGYMLAEMQSVTFMLKRGWNPYYFHLKVLVYLIFGIGVLAVVTKKFKQHRVLLLLGLLAGIFGWQMVRNLPIAGLIILPALAIVLNEIIERRPKILRNICLTIAGLAPLILLFWICFQGPIYCYFYPETSLDKLGLASSVNASADFIKNNHIQGPIFNNYDVGGYLIYHLYPQEKVFVDNRPEAYSVDFFKKLYVPMQEQESIWEVQDEKYKFNAIVFNRNDMTPWAQPFLIERIKDSAWAPVFVDDYVLILLKREEQNARIIRFFELPRELFIITK